jgi:hypothetical protein
MRHQSGSGDDAAKEVIKKAISLASMEEQKPKEEQKRKREQNPEDSQARRKKRVAKLTVVQDKVKEEVKESAMRFITNATWFGAATGLLTFQKLY